MVSSLRERRHWNRAPSQPARAALVLDLVGRKNLSNANALNAMAMNMTQVIGPALGGGMIPLLIINILGSALMGYFRPVASFNIGKQGEHAERTFFTEAGGAAHGAVLR